MIFKYLNIKKIALLAFFALIFPSAIFALEVTYPPLMGLSITSSSNLIDYVKYFINIGIGSAGLLAMGTLVIGGIYYLISLGIGKYKEQGLEWVKAGLFGMVLLLTSYLLLYTINPALISPMLGNLIPIPGFLLNNSNPASNGPGIVTYKEVPIGKLTETVLSGETNCYDFTDSGDPIQNKTKTDNSGDVAGPTFLVHDRADCLAKLNFAIEKKSDVIAKVAKLITGYMDQCGCQNALGCETPKNTVCPDLNPMAQWQVDQKCGGPLPCQCQTQNTCGLDQTEYKMCPLGYKKFIEHGPIKLEPLNFIDLKTLFPNASNPDKISFASCLSANLTNNSSNKIYKGLDEFRTAGINVLSIENQISVNNKPITAIDQKKWDALRLVDQVIYLRIKIDQLKNDLQNDLNNLQTSKDLLSSSQCYLAKPYVELVKTSEQTNNQEKTIVRQKTNNQYTGEAIDISKYCSGYNYTNSDCQTSCDNLCPVASVKNATEYKACASCPAGSPASCLQSQKLCLAQKVDERKCNQNAQGFNNFSECISTCRNTCSNNCSIKYKNCSDQNSACQTCTQTPIKNISCDQFSKSLCNNEFNNCQTNCQTNSQCLLENQDKCLYNYPALKNCADQNLEPSALESCVNNSLLCSFGSKQNAGYTDCLSKTRALEGKDFSSSALYSKNSSYQKCNTFFSSTLGTFLQGASYCKSPETAKCPTSSNCPQCPCTIIDPNTASSSSSSSSGYTSLNNNDYRVVSGECGQYVYNDDPLTFYCKQPFYDDPQEKNTLPEGTQRICAKNNEIPVGQAVDDTSIWGQNMLNNINNLLTKTDEYVDYLTTIGRETDYCECGSTCGGGESTCNADCKVVETTTTTTDGETTTQSCEKTGCFGNPCLKMIYMLLGKSAEDACPKGTPLKGAKQFQEEFLAFYKKINDFVIKSRTDIVKELSYSREKTNQCSVVAKAYDKTKETKMYNCTRVVDEIISPISGSKTIINSKEIPFPCYGKTLGEIISSGYNYSTNYSSASENIIPKTDNWFCCDQYNKPNN